MKIYLQIYYGFLSFFMDHLCSGNRERALVPFGEGRRPPLLSSYQTLHTVQVGRCRGFPVGSVVPLFLSWQIFVKRRKAVPNQTKRMEGTISLIKDVIGAINAVKNGAQEFNREIDTLKTSLDILTPPIEKVRKYEEEIADLSNNDEQMVQSRREMDNLVKELKDFHERVEKYANLWLPQKLIGSYKEQLEKCNARLAAFQLLMLTEMWASMKTNLKYQSLVPEPPEFIVGWREAVGELKQKLLEGEFPVIGICGPGGCGKSTLAQKFCEQVKGEFERISYITIPRSPDSPTEKKEEEMVDWIAMFKKLWDDLVGAGAPKPVFESSGGALEQLKQRLNKRKRGEKVSLIVLDGVRSDNMLRKLVIKTPGLKTLVTSREKFKGLNWSYRVRQLNMEDATNLFLYHAQALSRFRTSKDVQEKLVVKQIVEGCKFHPLALELIGASLKDSQFRKWRTTAGRLHDEGQIFDEHEKIYWPLKTSLESLKTVQRECFMDLICFPDNKRIRAAALMDMWVHTRGQDEDGAFNILKELADRHLIELFKRTRNESTDLDESFSDLFVVQHDLLRELAIYVSKEEKTKTRLIINGGDAVLDLVKEKDRMSHAQIASIRTGGNVNFDWVDVQFPRAEVLILNFSRSSYCLRPFLNPMKNLKVLVIGNHGMAAAVLSGWPPSGSLKSLSVVRLEKISLPIDCTLMEPLMGVRKLSLTLCEVKNEELEICSGFDIQTMFPDLTELEIDYCNGLERLPTSVCNIVHLQKLGITNCHDLSKLPEGIGRLSNLEVLRLSACTSLERLPDSLSELRKLRFLDLLGCSCIAHLPNSIDMLHSLEKIDLRRCFAKLPDQVIHFQRLRYVLCDADAKTLWVSMKTKCGRLTVRGFKDFVSLNFLR